MTTATAQNERVLYASATRYTDRASKAVYIAEKYRPILAGSVLDVGCDVARLRDLVGDPARYTGVDIQEGADVVVNLDRDNLPFNGESFDTVVCTDVLEHLERAPVMLDELFRVARERAIISLPNPLACVIESIAGGGRGRAKYYGLPEKAPVDRHRWFFSATEAEEFVRAGAARNGFVPEQIDFEPATKYTWRDHTGRNLLDDPAVTRGTMWAVFRREPFR
ncbi:MAG TPA: class I SAM-dependent methyltransferase [Phycisphaerales bacterium]|nr:class I SAM-dependent methyltransferase [Phycisphaerales bacterium]